MPAPPKNFTHRHIGQLSERAERDNARQFIDALLQELPGYILLESQSVLNEHVLVLTLKCSLTEWLTCSSCSEADERIVQFASNYCERQSRAPVEDEAVVLTGDGVYVVTCLTLLLNLKLVRSGYYESEEKSLHISEV